MEAWGVVYITEEMNTIESTWFFKFEKFLMDESKFSKVVSMLMEIRS